MQKKNRELDKILGVLIETIHNARTQSKLSLRALLSSVQQ